MNLKDTDFYFVANVVQSTDGWHEKDHTFIKQFHVRGGSEIARSSALLYGFNHVHSFISNIFLTSFQMISDDVLACCFVGFF